MKNNTLKIWKIIPKMYLLSSIIDATDTLLTTVTEIDNFMTLTILAHC